MQTISLNFAPLNTKVIIRINTYIAEIFLYKPWRPKVFSQFQSIINMSYLALSASFVKILHFQCEDRL